MALVAYGSDISDSEDEDDQNETEGNHSAPTKLVLPEPKDPVKPEASLFNILPKPKNEKWAPDVPEEVDEFLLKKAVATEELPPKPVLPKKLNERKPAKIMLPSLSSFDNDEDGDTQTKFKTAAVKGTGLLGMLPEPKTSEIYLRAISSTKFVPNVLTKAPVKPIKPVIPKKNKVLAISYESSDDSDELSDADAKEKETDFFSLNKEEEIIPMPPSDNLAYTVTDNVDYTQPESSHSVNYTSNEVYQNHSSYGYDEIPMNHTEPDAGRETGVESAKIDDEAMRILCGSSKRRKGEAMEFIDIDQKEIMPDAREWLTKALTENSNKRTSSVKRKGNDPNNQQKRKHQITYLAQQARANEQELQNQWANNRMTRKQTQSKYGF